MFYPVKMVSFILQLIFLSACAKFHIHHSSVSRKRADRRLTTSVFLVITPHLLSSEQAPADLSGRVGCQRDREEQNVVST